MNIQTRVRLHGEGTRYHTVEYKKPGFFSVWRQINTAITFHHNPADNHCRQPLLFNNDFEGAVAQAQQFKTLEDVHSFERREYDRLREANRKLSARIEGREYWESGST